MPGAETGAGVLRFCLTFCSHPKVVISEDFIVNQARTLIAVQSSIQPLNRHFWVSAVSRLLFFSVTHFESPINLVRVQLLQVQLILTYVSNNPK